MCAFNYKELGDANRRKVRNTLINHGIHYKKCSKSKRMLGNDINDEHLHKLLNKISSSTHYGTMQLKKFIEDLLSGKISK